MRSSRDSTKIIINRQLTKNRTITSHMSVNSFKKMWNRFNLRETHLCHRFLPRPLQPFLALPNRCMKIFSMLCIVARLPYRRRTQGLKPQLRPPRLTSPANTVQSDQPHSAPVNELPDDVTMAGFSFYGLMAPASAVTNGHLFFADLRGVRGRSRHPRGQTNGLFTGAYCKCNRPSEYIEFTIKAVSQAAYIALLNDWWW